MSLAEAAARRPAGTAATPAALPLAAWAWVGAFALVGACWLFAGLAAIEPPRSQAFVRHNEERLRAFAAEAGAPGTPALVMLGNSRLKFGTLAGPDLDRAAGEAGLAGLAVLRIVNDWAVFDDFDPFLAGILAARPDAIVIQSELLVQERAGDATLLIAREYVKWRLLGFAFEPWNPGRVDQQALQEDADCTPTMAAETLEERLGRTSAWLASDAAGPNAAAALAFIARAMDAGIAVFVLDLPRRPEMERLGTAALPPLPPGVVRLAAGPAPGGGFCDHVHLNAEGRAWLTRALLGELGPRL